jgi:hypothetical protein
MIVYRVKGWAGLKPVTRKARISDKSARLEKKLRTYRRQWFWDNDRWNQRHGIKE